MGKELRTIRLRVEVRCKVDDGLCFFPIMYSNDDQVECYALG